MRVNRRSDGWEEIKTHDDVCPGPCPGCSLGRALLRLDRMAFAVVLGAKPHADNRRVAELTPPRIAFVAIPTDVSFDVAAGWL